MKPTGLAGVELTHVDPPGQSLTVPPVLANQMAQEKKQQIELEPTFCTHVGWGGILVLLFSAFAASVVIIVIIMYSNNGKWDRPGLWVLWILLAVYSLFGFKCVCLWKKLVRSFTKEHQTMQYRRLHRAKSATEKLLKAKAEAKNFHEKIQINGSFYLWKVYASELLESALQFRNLLLTYSCMFPTEALVFFSVLLTIDCTHTAWNMLQENNPSRRIRQATIDLVMDLICSIITLGIPALVYKIPIPMSETLWVLPLPLIFGVLKLDDIFEDIIRARTAAEVFKLQGKEATEQMRRRESIFVGVTYLSMAKLQDEKMPKKLKQAAATCKGLFAFFFFITAVLCLSTYAGVSESCYEAFGEKIWGKGCQLKVPFCRRFFEPQCNCAVFDVKNYNASRLPERFTEWTALRRVRIHNGLLEELPSGFMDLNNVARLEITSNRLKSFDVDVTKWNNLIYLFLYDNEIARMHKSVLRSQSLVNLDVALNVNFNIFAGVKEEDAIHMPSLMYLNLKNNSATIQLKFMGKNQFPALKFLHLDGNIELVFGEDSFKTLSNNLRQFTIGRCNIKKLPPYMSIFKNINMFDARNNNITQVNSDFLDALKKNDGDDDFEVLFAGNPACQDSNTRKEIRSKVGETSCEPLCSTYCWSRKVGGNGFCDDSCNSEKCYYDGCNLEGCNYDQSDCKNVGL